MDIKTNEYLYYSKFGIVKVLSIVEKDGEITYNVGSKNLKISFNKKDILRLKIRKLSSNEKVKEANKVLSSKLEFKSLKNWNQRFRAYNQTLIDGDLVEIAKIYAELSGKPKLSFLEKELKNNCKQLVDDETILVLK